MTDPKKTISGLDSVKLTKTEPADTKTLVVDAQEIAASISPREYNRLLSLPPDQVLEGDLLERADSARAWYAQHGNPYVAYRRSYLKQISDAKIAVSGEPHSTATVQFTSSFLARRLREGDAHGLIVMAASAGTEVSNEVARLWSIEHPDEAFFLDRFAVAITERLLFWASATLCRESEQVKETLLPHLSPGCGHWDFEDQHKVMAFLTGTEQQESPGTFLGPLQLLSSGALHPQHSVLAAMGVTHLKFVYAPELLCRSCDLNPCEFRRAPFGGEALRLLERK
jgi:hypothetical protein